MKRLLLLSFLLTIAVQAYTQAPRDLSVELNAVVDGPVYTITWPEDARANNYIVDRRLAGASTWESQDTLSATAASFADFTLVPGQLYEFRVRKNLRVGSNFTAYGYIYGGMAIEHPIAQGIVILVVDDSFATDLSSELLRLEDDLLNEGWQVRRTNVKRYWSPPQVKEAIMNIYQEDPGNTKAVFLFGHVPVPYSGMIVPDGHINNHLMPWPADAYYGDDADWYDEVDYDTMLIYQTQQGLDTVVIPKANRNFAGDGKFDHHQFPDIIDLRVGRVDLANMPAFTKSEKELLRQYLDKDHAYRTGQLTAPPRALIDDNFGTFSVNESFASSAWRAFPQLVGRDSIHDNSSVDWFTTLSEKPYLWAYGCGGGSFTSCGGVGTTTDFATKGSKAIFTMLFGSYFGDWNVTNNLLRAPLATEYGLSCAWSGRPYWYFQPMAIGLPIGFCARLTQNNYGAYLTGPSAGSIHVGLMGDPTLKMNVIAPPTNAVAFNEGFNRVRLTWTLSPDSSIAGYNIYKAHEPEGPYYLSNQAPISGVSEYMDTVPFSGKNVYMIHAVRNEVTAAGTYLNLSPAARVTIDGIQSGVASAQPEGTSALSARESSTGTEFTLQVNATADVRFALYNYLGEQVKLFDDRMLSAGPYTYQWTRAEKEIFAQGLYFAVAHINGKVHQVRVLNFR